MTRLSEKKHDLRYTLNGGLDRPICAIPTAMAIWPVLLALRYYTVRGIKSDKSFCVQNILMNSLLYSLCQHVSYCNPDIYPLWTMYPLWHFSVCFHGCYEPIMIVGSCCSMRVTFIWTSANISNSSESVVKPKKLFFEIHQRSLLFAFVK